MLVFPKRADGKRHSGARRQRHIFSRYDTGMLGDGAKPTFRRLARRGGVKRISGLMCEESRWALRLYLKPLIRDCVLRMEDGYRATLGAGDVKHALARKERKLYS